MKINLVQDGIFPIKGKLLEDSTGFESPGTFQGEGKLLGTACLFIRTSGCNLKCAWRGLNGKGSLCDTPYSSFMPETCLTEVGEIVQVVLDNSNDGKIRHIVVSGGEPLIQPKPLEELVKLLKVQNFHVTIETNGTKYSNAVARWADLISLSPKLSSSTPYEENLEGTGVDYNEKRAKSHETKRLNLTSLKKWVETSNDFQLKFVVEKPADILEIEDILLKLEMHIDPSEVCLMPEGVDVETLQSRTKWIADAAVKRGWRFTPRLHIMMFGKNRYV
jgi:7-carboxy-7-deazaguanine synthase